MSGRLLLALVVLAGLLCAQGQRASAGLSDFEVTRLAGFTVLLSPQLAQDDPVRGRLLWRLEEQLRETSAALPPGAVDELRRVRLWLDPLPGGTSEMGPAAYYLGLGAAPLVRGLVRAQVGDIRLVDAQKFIDGHGRYNLLLHELAHAYDDRRWQFAHPGVVAAFEQARRSGRYSGAGALGDHHAMAGVPEYFAELTVAYFAARSTTPQNRAELRAFDPAGYAAIRAAWEVR